MTSPASTAEPIARWTPPALADLAAAPVFLIATIHRGAKRLQIEVIKHGLKTHTTAEHRAEINRALRSLWPAAELDTNLTRLRALWGRLDAGEALPAAEQAPLDELAERLHAAWPPLADMAEDDLRWTRDVPKVAASLTLRGWEGLPVLFTREGAVPLAVIDDVEEAFATIERSNGQEPGAAFFQLTAHCLSILGEPATAASGGAAAGPNIEGERR